MNTPSITVVDDFHITAGTNLQEMCKQLNNDIELYVKILNQMITDAAKAGYTTERYQGYIEIISGLQGQLSRMGDMLNLTATDYVTMIESADSYLYKGE